MQSHVRNRLSHFFIPRDVIFVNELPRNETGKIVRRQLTEHHFAHDADWPI